VDAAPIILTSAQEAHFREQFDSTSLGLLRTAFADLNRIEARFRPAFDEDDLFGNNPDLLPQIILGIQSIF
jgi:hypothetical protein